MPDTALRDVVLKRLSPRAPSAVTGGEGPAISAPAQRPPREPRIAFLRSIAVEGFRGIGPKATLDLTPGNDMGVPPWRTERGEASCYDCLMSYSNQSDHKLLGRKAIGDLLAALLTARVESAPASRGTSSSSG